MSDDLLRDPVAEPLLESAAEAAGPDTGTGMVAGAGWTLAAQLAALGLGFPVSVLIARALGPAGKGQLALLMQAVPLATVILGLGLNTANAYYAGRGRRTTGQLVSDSLGVAIVLGGVGSPLLWLLLRHAIPALSGTPDVLLILAVAPLTLYLVYFYLSGMLTGLGSLRTLAIMGIASAVGTFGLVGAAYLSGWLSPTFVLATSGVSFAGLAIAALAAAWRRGAHLVAPSIARIREQVPYAARAYVGSIASYLDRRQDVFLLGILSNASSVGIYSVATAFTELVWQVPRAVAAPLLSTSMHVDRETGARIAAQAARVSGMLMLAVFTTIAAVIYPMIDIVFTPAFRDAGLAFLLLGPGALIYGFGIVLWNYLATHDVLLPRVALFSTLLNLVANVLLIPRLGFAGAAIASTLSYSASGVAFSAVFLRFSGMKASDVLVPKPDDWHLLASLPAVIAQRFSRARGR